MTASTTALIGFVLWTLALVLIVILHRVALTLTGQKQAHQLSQALYKGPIWYERATEAHKNCLENLPLFGAVVFAAVVTGNEAIVDPLAFYYLGARIAQSMIHLLAVNHWAVMARFTAYLVQIGIVAYSAIQMILQYFAPAL
jgi:uncharacterized MAPEG superfamily protein